MNTRALAKGLHQFLSEDDGVTAIEYGLLAALIVVAIVAAVGLLGDNVKALFDDVAAKVVSAWP